MLMHVDKRVIELFTAFKYFANEFLAITALEKKVRNWRGLFVWNANFYQHKTKMLWKASFPHAVSRQ